MIYITVEFLIPPVDVDLFFKDLGRLGWDYAVISEDGGGE